MTDYEIDTEEEAESEETPTPYDKEIQTRLLEIVTHRLDIPMTAVAMMIAKGQIDLAPEFQRHDIWKPRQKSRLIESLVMGVPIPPVFLGEEELGKYVVLDGRQRLTAINEYLTNVFSLSGLQVWSSLNGKKFKSLEKQVDPPVMKMLMRRTVPAIVVLNESSADVKFEVFDRLNTGGNSATPMEVRNAIYRTAFTKAIAEFAANEDFLRLWAIPSVKKQREKNKLFERMLDRELVLRFLALREPELFKGRLRDHLTRYLERRGKEYLVDTDLAKQDEADFIKATRLAWSIFGDEAFTRPSDTGRTDKRSFPMADAVMHGCLALPEPFDVTDVVRRRFRDGVDVLYTDDAAFRKSIDSATNARESTIRRIRDAQKLFVRLAEGAA